MSPIDSYGMTFSIRADGTVESRGGINFNAAEMISGIASGTQSGTVAREEQGDAREPGGEQGARTATLEWVHGPEDAARSAIVTINGLTQEQHLQLLGLFGFTHPGVEQSIALVRTAVGEIGMELIDITD